MSLQNRHLVRQGRDLVKITEALKITQSAPANARPFSVVLACGFTPLHLQTFLSAHLQQALPNRKVVVTTGLYGNLAETLEGTSDSAIDGVAIALEWSDLDARLDFRSAGSWGRSAATDIVANAQAMLDRVATAISRVPSGVRVALALPTLPMPPRSSHSKRSDDEAGAKWMAGVAAGSAKKRVSAHDGAS